ncbi:hypothetical protein M2451_001200 [Dysgonomonas sp. PFB1-18]|uniref:DUF2752 domain-containing protein n=1 Tax=unclassified Dysgonomonas TaxID=2630389 RepID=UPI00247492B8|nr:MULTISPECIES: DUF2752 domain-containing protein [unclassified Dysgonomonas]MDH6308175.1 hypothetical protein [Dysgonomonas sp. PF1-14]MDH6338386.1 hypothetical protein [Dysgonomonas sp. PF1-16]MDH6379883.1 hypothetical protein [Dysgonomonas sp. PFB1-18]MDH6397027.1 hypothetical protein [Dysgonomonas sp. PF1-23]
MCYPNSEKSSDRSKYITRLFVILIVLFVGGLVYYLFSPEESGFFPRCPFHTLTGFECPGCGSQRAIHHLVHFDLHKAFTSNPLLIISIPYILVCLWLEYFGGKQKYPKIRKALYGKSAIYAVLIIIIAFWIGRNLI